MADAIPPPPSRVSDTTPAPAPCVTQARGKPVAPNAPPTMERVQLCMDYMLGGTWGPQREAELARAWDVSPSTVRRAAAEASRLVRSKTSPEDIKDRLESLVGEALDMAREAGGTQGAAILLRAAQVLAQVHGVGAPKGPSAPAPNPPGGAELPFGFTAAPAPTVAGGAS